MFQQFNQIVRAEHTIGVDRLAALAREAVCNTYGITPSEMGFELEISESDVVCNNAGEIKGTTFSTPDPDPLNEELVAEVEKRKIVNSMILGAGLKAEKLFAAIDELPESYKQQLSRFTDMQEMMLNQMPPQMMVDIARDAPVSGVSSYYFDEFSEKYVVQAKGAVLSSLLHETTKGVFSVISQWGLPKDDPETVAQIKHHADTLENEVLGFQTAARYWQLVLDKAKDSGNTIADTFKEVVQLSPGELKAYARR